LKSCEQFVIYSLIPFCYTMYQKFSSIPWIAFIFSSRSVNQAFYHKYNMFLDETLCWSEKICWSGWISFRPTSSIEILVLELELEVLWFLKMSLCIRSWFIVGEGMYLQKNTLTIKSIDVRVKIKRQSPYQWRFSLYL